MGEKDELLPADEDTEAAGSAEQYAYPDYPVFNNTPNTTPNVYDDQRVRTIPPPASTAQYY
jgi:hypothetical protein